MCVIKEQNEPWDINLVYITPLPALYAEIGWLKTKYRQ